MHLKQQNYRQSPWKNGQGITSEIDIFPDGATVADANFLWRLSTARIAASGPFSRFSGYDRFLTVLSSKKIRLRFEKDAQEKVLAEGEVIQFSGDEEVSCVLDSDVVMDLGLIYRRDLVKAQFKILEIKSTPFEFQNTSRQAFVFQGDTWSFGPGKIALPNFEAGTKIALITLDW